MISIVIPTFNEENTIEKTLDQFSNTKNIEIIVADGGSRDRTTHIATKQQTIVIKNITGGRGGSLAAGGAKATGDITLFLHADTILPNNWQEQITTLLSNHAYIGGAFRLQFGQSPSWSHRQVARYSNTRAALTGMYHGDQAMFIRTGVLKQMGGYPNVELMEDVLLSNLMKKAGKTKLLPGPVITSNRRLTQNGLIKSIFLYFFIKTLFFFRIPPKKLIKIYRWIQS